MRTHLQVLGWAHVALHVLYVIGGLGVLMLGSAGATLIAAVGGHSLMPLAAIIAAGGWMVALALLVVGLPGTVIGWGLAHQSGWARIPGIILSILSLPAAPIGTIVGIYGLVVLFHPDSGAYLRPRAIESV
jgi:hypothetical protein